ncbi:MAG: sulfatase-like hydrolase/transferase, partial [Pirellulales bacterium]|nr:sulfatase-like hydrolase/transferase [Pirellulales bacterium]
MEFILWTILAHVTTTTLLTEHVLAARPNVLMIVLDDMNDWAGCLHTRQDVQTPNIDRLAEKGMLFTNAHCTAPVCNASRVATLTGRQPGSTGIYDNGVRWHEAMPGIPSIPKHFKQNGYHVAGGGKIYHHMPGFNRLSDWDEY